MADIAPRSAISNQYKWNAEVVFASPEAWAAELKTVTESLGNLTKYQGRLGEGAKILADYIEESEALLKRALLVSFYANMSQACETSDQTAGAMAGQAGSMIGQLFATIAFLDPELLTIGQEKLNQWIKSEPRLASQQQYVNDLFRRQAHVRSGEVEELLGMAQDPFGMAGNTYQMLMAADMKFEAAKGTDGKSETVTQGTLGRLLGESDREVRRTAWENYADQYLALKNTMTSNYTLSVKQDVFLARARRYETALEAALFQNNIPASVFHNLVDTYKKNIPTWHKYWRVRRKALGVDTLEPYDIWAPLTKTEPEVKYEEAVDWITEGMKPLGEEYVSALRRGCLEERWVDLYPNLGKTQGAFSYGSPGTHPFILMNYNDDLKSMSTLAHELGHSMHSYLTWKNQPFTYSNYSLFAAEVASNFNQALVRSYLMEHNSDPVFQIALIEEAMANFHRYFFIMPTLARFEYETHSRIESGGALTPDYLINLMADLFSEGYGSEMHVDRERVGITWAQFPHMYQGYYVFQYATGISGAHAFAERVLEKGESAAKAYLGFLSSGSAIYPLDAMKQAGVDLSTPEAVEKTFDVLARYVDRLEQLTAVGQPA